MLNPTRRSLQVEWPKLVPLYSPHLSIYDSNMPQVTMWPRDKSALNTYCWHAQLSFTPTFHQKWKTHSKVKTNAEQHVGSESQIVVLLLFYLNAHDSRTLVRSCLVEPGLLCSAGKMCPVREGCWATAKCLRFLELLHRLLSLYIKVVEKLSRLPVYQITIVL